MGVLLLGIVLLAACARPAQPPAAEDLIEGPLAGDPALEGGCAWLESDTGRYEVVWPDGYEIRFTPLRLVGPDGEVVAAEGEVVRVHGAVAEDMVSVCQVGTLYRADSVSTPE